MRSFLTLVLVTVFVFSYGDLATADGGVEIDREKSETQQSLKAVQEESRDLQWGIKQPPQGRQMANNCMQLFPNNPTMGNGLTCKAPCNNPCNQAPWRFPNGCGVGMYCSCAYNTKMGQQQNPLMSCSFCPYTKAGTECPGDGFYYDKTFAPPPPPAPKPVAPPRAPTAPQCDGNTFGTCKPGEYCRQKSTDWTYVCTSPCPVGVTCPGDGKRYPTPRPPTPPAKPPTRNLNLRGAWEKMKFALGLQQANQQ